VTGRRTTGSAAIVARVERTLRAFLAERATALATVDADLAPVAEIAHRFVLDGGKRLRPLFAYWGWRTVRDRDADDSAVLNAAAALELLHACALVHDDVMDDSAIRRGHPSAHETFARLHQRAGWPGDQHVFGVSAAIVLGDLLLSWADSLFAGAGLDRAAAARARAVYDSMREQVIAGQYLDVLEQARADLSVDAALKVINYKTSKYTVEGPLHFGAAAAGAPAAVLAALSRYGLALGEAFQLRDDLLGLFGDPYQTGKPSGDDLREGKPTLLVALAMRRADVAQAAVLRRGLGDRTLNAAGVAGLCEVLVATGAVHAVEERIEQRAAQASAALAEPALAADARSALRRLVTVATERRT
jgi:geranylgeranyl diphosphate synthase, type I